MPLIVIGAILFVILALLLPEIAALIIFAFGILAGLFGNMSLAGNSMLWVLGLMIYSVIGRKVVRTVFIHKA